MKYKCIIFDCDGVLVDSEAISSQVLVDMISELGSDLRLNDAIAEFSGKSFNSIVTYIDERIDGNIPADFEKKFRERTFESFQNHLEPIKGIHELLEKLTTPFCVASSGPRDKIILNLTKTGLIHKFPEKNIFSCYDIGSWKPEPDIYLYAAKQMGFEPKDCAVIEDSTYGITAAVSGGFDTFAYAKAHEKERFKEIGAIKIFDDMVQLNALLSK